MDEVWLTAGEDYMKSKDGRYLYITSNADVFGEDKPEVYYIRRE